MCTVTSMGFRLQFTLFGARGVRITSRLRAIWMREQYANLQVPDRAYPEIGSSTAALTINVEDTPTKHGGCAAIPAAAPVAGVALALLAFLGRRRLRK